MRLPSTSLTRNHVRSPALADEPDLTGRLEFLEESVHLHPAEPGQPPDLCVREPSPLLEEGTHSKPHVLLLDRNLGLNDRLPSEPLGEATPQAIARRTPSP